MTILLKIQHYVLWEEQKQTLTHSLVVLRVSTSLLCGICVNKGQIRIRRSHTLQEGSKIHTPSLFSLLMICILHKQKKQLRAWKHCLCDSSPVHDTTSTSTALPVRKKTFLCPSRAALPILCIRLCLHPVWAANVFSNHGRSLPLQHSASAPCW